MKAKKINLNQAARKLGLSTRQVRRLVTSGQITATGGGRGVPLEFTAGALEEFIAGRSGVVDAEVLSRMAYALVLRRADPACRWLPEFRSTMLWEWRDNKTMIDLYLRNCLPPLEDVPDRLREAVVGLCHNLKPSEIDYIGATIVVVAWPWKWRQPGERWAYGQALKEALKHPRKDLDALVSAYESGDVEHIYSLIYGYEQRDGSWQHATFPELQDDEKFAPGILLAACAKQRKDIRERNRGKPTGRRVATLLGIHHEQGRRAARAIEGKASPADLRMLFQLVGLDEVPCVWETKPTGPRPRAVERPIEEEDADGWSAESIAAAIAEDSDRIERISAGQRGSSVSREDDSEMHVVGDGRSLGY